MYVLCASFKARKYRNPVLKHILVFKNKSIHAFTFKKKKQKQKGYIHTKIGWEDYQKASNPF